MLLYACRAVAEIAFERAVVEPRRRGTVSTRQLVREILLAGVPADKRHRLGASVWYAFVTKAPTWPALAAVVRAQLSGARRFVEAALSDAAAKRQLRAGVDPSVEATALLALADGLVLRAMVGAVDRATAVKVVDSRLDRMFA
jgi:TetR/AcrR family transcriptional regulator, transcriptional repressor of bet genes